MPKWKYSLGETIKFLKNYIRIDLVINAGWGVFGWCLQVWFRFDQRRDEGQQEGRRVGADHVQSQESEVCHRSGHHHSAHRRHDQTTR